MPQDMFKPLLMTLTKIKKLRTPMTVIKNMKQVTKTLMGVTKNQFQRNLDLP